MKLAAVLTLILSAGNVAAQTAPPPQVGYPTTQSPFRDLEYRQEVTFFGGWLAAAKDPAGVAPLSGPMAGARYEVVVGGPASLYARGARVFTERNIIDPTKPAATRALGVMNTPLYLADAGLSVSLTGQRSFHRIVPVVSGGAGIATTLNSKAEGDPYEFGTTFAISLGGGLRFVPGGNFQVRIDGGTWLYQIKYPAAYYVPASDKTQVLPDRQAKNFWKSNPAISIGASYLFFR